MQQLGRRLQEKAAQIERVHARSPHAEIVDPPIDDWRPDHVASSSEMLEMELWIRLLFSALCDADFLDTEAFYDPAKSAARARSYDLDALRARLDEYVGAKARTDTEVNRVRADVRAACIDAASMAPGVFSLTVPREAARRSRRWRSRYSMQRSTVSNACWSPSRSRRSSSRAQGPMGFSHELRVLGGFALGEVD